MKHLFALSSLILLFACNQANKEEITTDAVNNPLSATEDSNQTEMSRISFPESVYNFGTITQGEKVSHSFRFKNEGETDLVITIAKGACGCTVPKWPKTPIHPGREGVIEVIFDSKGKSGQQNKQITIVANTQPSTSVIALKGEVIAPSK